jgi:pre-mRNA-processing factor 40
LLGSLRQEGAINAYTQWKEIYPRVADDARYTNLLGVPSSTPLDLFWDLVDDLDRDLYDQRKKVQEYLKVRKGNEGFSLLSQ